MGRYGMISDSTHETGCQYVLIFLGGLFTLYFKT